MLPQREDSLTVITLAHAHGKLVAVGGPDPTSSPESYELADFTIFVGIESPDTPLPASNGSKVWLWE